MSKHEQLCDTTLEIASHLDPQLTAGLASACWVCVFPKCLLRAGLEPQVLVLKSCFGTFEPLAGRKKTKKTKKTKKKTKKKNKKKGRGKASTYPRKLSRAKT